MSDIIYVKEVNNMRKNRMHKAMTNERLVTKLYVRKCEKVLWMKILFIIWRRFTILTRNIFLDKNTDLFLDLDNEPDLWDDNDFCPPMYDDNVFV